MKRSSINAGLIACGICLMMAAAGAIAQNPATRPGETTRPADGVAPPAGPSNAGQLDDKTTGANIRASKLTGMSIQNSSGESVGKVHDVVLDAANGRVRYVAVTYGGFLGIGDKLFAVPFEAFRCERDPNDADDFVLVLDVTKSQMEGATGFDEEHWPNFGDREFTRELDRRYNIDRRPRRDRTGVDVNVDTNGVDVRIEGKRPENNNTVPKNRE